jgi:hypothetical protein
MLLQVAGWDVTRTFGKRHSLGAQAFHLGEHVFQNGPSKVAPAAPADPADFVSLPGTSPSMIDWYPWTARPTTSFLHYQLLNDSLRKKMTCQ